jgi:hypothetical protein
LHCCQVLQYNRRDTATATASSLNIGVHPDPFQCTQHALFNISCIIGKGRAACHWKSLFLAYTFVLSLQSCRYFVILYLGRIRISMVTRVCLHSPGSGNVVRCLIVRVNLSCSDTRYELRVSLISQYNTRKTTTITRIKHTTDTHPTHGPHIGRGGQTGFSWALSSRRCLSLMLWMCSGPLVVPKRGG